MHLTHALLRPVRACRCALLAGIAMSAIFAGGNALAALDLRNAKVHHLDNDLTVILLEDHNFPVASVQMLYRVGARDEVTGKTGLAHFLEHMAFRASENFPDTGLVSSIYARGGEWHGYTWTDQTTYFATVPAEHLGLLLDIEADRMSRLTLPADKMEAERGAVLAEMHMYENSPTSMLIDALMFTSFLAHPYRNNTIGWESDIEALEHAAVVDFYERHYHPANAVLAVVGDFDSTDVLAEVRARFGDVAPRPPTPLPVTVEPPQTAERRITLHGHTDRERFLIGYRAPAVKHADFAAFLVLQHLLGAGSGISFLQNDWGTSVSDDSLLAGAADDLATWYPPSAQNYIFTIGGMTMAGVTRAKTEAEIEKRVTVARQTLFDDEDMAAAIDAARDELVFDIETTEDAAHQLAFFAGLDALDVLLTLPARLGKVTAGDVRRVASTWLQPQQRTIAWHVPGAVPPAPTFTPAQTIETPRTGAAADRVPVPAPVIRDLSGGLRVILQQSDLSSTVHLRMIVPGDVVVAAESTAAFPLTGYTSIGFGGRADALRQLVQRAGTTLDEARFAAPAAAARSNDPEIRLEQAFADTMPGSAAHDGIPAPVLLVMSGDFEIDTALRLLEEHFALSPASRETRRLADAVPEGHETVTLGVPLAQAQLGYIVSAAGPATPAHYAQRMLQYIFAHGYEGRLGKAAISERGLAYYVDSRYRSDGVNGWVTLGIGVDPKNVAPLTTLLGEELQRLRDEPPTLAEVDEARAWLAGRAASAAQSNPELTAALATQYLWHEELVSQEELEKRLASVSHGDVLQLVPGFTNGRVITVRE